MSAAQESSKGLFRNVLNVVRASRAFKIGLALALGALAVEAVAYVWYGIAFGAFYGAGVALRSEELSPANKPTDWRERTGLRVQPFSGFTTGSPSDERNTHPPHQGGDAIVIGVFGGYFADGVAWPLQQAVAQRLSQLAVDAEPVVVDLAIGHGRQPQQLMTAINRLAHGGNFDIVVNLDGVDDMSPLGADELLALAPDVIGGTENAMARQLAADVLREERRRLLRTGQGWLRLSAVFGLAHSSRLDRLESEIRELDAVVAKRRSSLHRNRRWEPTSREQLAAAARLWYRSSMMTSRIARAAGADYYHFLQPSQYMAGSKRLTEQERADAFDPEAARDNRYASMYSVLLQLGREMAEHGTVFVDLTGAFRDSDETLYKDFQRLNDLGSALLAESIVPHIEPSIVAKARAMRQATPDSAGETASDALQIRAHYDIYLRGTKHLVYKRDSCEEEDTTAQFFLHVLPRRVDDLAVPEDGFENLDFDFDARGIRIGGRCIAERRLPDYDIEQLRTGQARETGRIWQVQIHLGPPSGPFKVFRRGVDGLVYKKADCTLADTQHGFFLHARPRFRADAGDRPTMPDGYANLDFGVDLANVLRKDGSCVIERRVPFEFVELRTGQVHQGTHERLWQRDIDRA